MNLNLIVAVVVILGFLVCLGFSIKVWRWFHLIMALFVFGTACWLLCLVSFTLKTRSNWQRKHTELLNRKTLLDSEYQYAIKGALNKVKEEKDNLQDVDSMLTRLLLDRGRVWRETKPQGVQGNFVLVDTGFVPVANEPLQIEKNAVFYVFKETLIQVEGLDIAVPVKYLGEFHVNAVNGGVISLEPSPAYQWSAAIAAPHSNDGSTWVIYEKIPADGHRLFSETDIFDSDVVLGADPTPLFGKMDREKISESFQMAIQHSPDLQRQQQRLEYHVERYMGDGRQLLGDETAPFEEQWIKVEFNTKYEVTVDSDAAKAGLTESFFDPSGMAVIPNLRRGETVQFERGDIGVFHLRSESVDGKPEVTDGEKLTAVGDDGTSIARQLTAHHVRSLTDYAFLFHDLSDRATRLFQQNILYDREKIRLAESLQEANKQIGFRQGEVDKLTVEKTFQEKDRDTAQTYVDKLTRERETLRVELAGLFNLNRQLTQQLAEIQARLEADINNRTDAVGRDSE
jgi:hypothetical protein